MATSRPDLYKDLEELLACALCLERCEHPRSLPCLHIYCTKCLQQLLEKSGLFGHFLCPSCRTTVQVPPGGVEKFPQSFHWHTLGETIDKFKSLHLHGKPQCTTCAKNSKQSNAESLCIECMKTFCSECLNTHNEIVANHNTLACGNIKAEDLNDIVKTRASRCNKHADEVIKLYCDSCKELVCVLCAVLDHATHNKRPLEEVAATHLDNLTNVEARFSHRVGHYDRCLQTVDDTKQEVQADITNSVQLVQQHGQEAMKQLQMLIQQVTMEIKTEGAKSVAKLETLHDTLSQERSCLVNTGSLVQASLKHGNSPTVINTSVQETPAYEQLLCDLLPKHDLPKTTFALQLSDFKQLTKETLIGTTKVTTHSEPLAENTSVPQSVTDVPHTGKLVSKKLRQFNVPYTPWGVASMTGDCIVVSEHWGSQVSVFQSDGRLKTKLQTPQHTHVTDVSFADNRILVADIETASILVFSPDGAYNGSIPIGFKDDAGVCLFNNKLLVTSRYEDKVYQVDWPSGTNKQVFVEDTPNAELVGPWYLTSDTSRVAVSCIGNNTVNMYDGTGQLQFTYTGEGSPTGRLNSPRGVAIDQQGRLLISDYGNNSIHFVSRQGLYLGHIDLASDGISGPLGLAIHNDLLHVGSFSPEQVETYQYTFQ